jgi:HAE1 family hydrophobic/amphiphilic exporter-1
LGPSVQRAVGTPIAVFGAFLALWIRGFENNVYAQIGLVMLIGLSAKNAILIVEFARTERMQGKSALDAALEGARIRLRPILMTAFAFIFGTIPLAIASGAGAVASKYLVRRSSAACSRPPCSRFSSSR